MAISYAIELLRITRTNFLKLIDNCTLEEINKIPEGFNNNLAWNLAHILSSQQALCYELSSLTPRVDKSLIDRFRPGTRPEEAMTGQELENLRQLMKHTIELLKEDYQSGMFVQYTPRQTKYGALIEHIDQAIPYVALHEGLHFGYAKALLAIIRRDG